MHSLACPKCHLPLIKDGKTYHCENNHSYDIAKKQYLNLLLNPDKSSQNPGDNKESLMCRRNFLLQGYYDHILAEVIRIIDVFPHDQILDLGCGEGYYTSHIKDAFPHSIVYGLDISKVGIQMATQYTKNVFWIVGNSKNIPIENESLDMIIALFTVVNADEIKRCLKKNGHMIHVTARPDHLIEFKKLIYDEIITKDEKNLQLPLKVKTYIDFKEYFHLRNRKDTLNLLKMTPHYYHIKKEKRHILDELGEFDASIHLKITVYEK